MTRASKVLPLVAAAALLSTSQTSLRAAEIPSDWNIDNVRRSESATGIEVVEIRNLHGDLRVRPSEQEEIFYSAMIQHHADDPLRAEIDTKGDGSTYRLEIVYPEIDGFDLRDQPDSWRKRRVDVTLFVPATVQLVIETDRGLIEVKGLDRGITARSISGDIVLATAGHVVARTERGSIAARFSETAWTAPIELETVTGSIAVNVPPQADTTVIMTTSGELTTDFSLTVERQPEGNLKTARAKIGTGRAELSLKSLRGNVKLLRDPS